MERLQFETIGDFIDFVELYKVAEQYKQSSFLYRDNSFSTQYAYYVIEYVKSSVGVDDETIDNLLKHRAEVSNTNDV